MLTIEFNKPKTTRKWLTTTGQRHYPHDKPTVTCWYNNGQKCYEYYHLHNQLHRDNDKPARTSWHSNGQKHYEFYYLNGTPYTPKEPTC